MKYRKVFKRNELFTDYHQTLKNKYHTDAGYLNAVTEKRSKKMTFYKNQRFSELARSQSSFTDEDHKKISNNMQKN